MLIDWLWTRVCQISATTNVAYAAAADLPAREVASRIAAQSALTAFGQAIEGRFPYTQQLQHHQHSFE